MKEALKVLLYLVAFLCIAQSNKYSAYFHYTPQYPYKNESFFQILIQHPSKGIIISYNVQMHRGLNLQVVSGKQYFMPRKVVLSDGHVKVDLHCVGDQYNSSRDFEKQLRDCFIKRPKTEWVTIAKLLDAPLVMTEKNVRLENLKLIAENNDFNLYEIEP